MISGLLRWCSQEKRCWSKRFVLLVNYFCCSLEASDSVTPRQSPTVIVSKSFQAIFNRIKLIAEWNFPLPGHYPYLKYSCCDQDFIALSHPQHSHANLAIVDFLSTYTQHHTSLRYQVSLKIPFTSVKHDLICPRVLIGSNKVDNKNINLCWVLCLFYSGNF